MFLAPRSYGNQFEKLEKIDLGGHFQAHKSSSIFYGVTVDIEGKRMLTGN